MSVYATVQYPALLFKVLNTVKLNRDRECWATVVFTDGAVVLRVEGSDQSSTATAILPRKVFSDYAITELGVEVHLQTLMDAMHLLGPAALVNGTVTVRIVYGAADGRLLVELSDPATSTAGVGGAGGGYGGGGAGAMASMAALAGGLATSGQRVLSARIVTRPVRENHLDLHFREAPIVAQATLLGDAMRDAVADLIAAQCTEVTLTLDAAAMTVRLSGNGGPVGTLDVYVRRSSTVLLSVESGGPSAGPQASTNVSTRHLALACGIRGTGGGGAGGGGGGPGMIGGGVRGRMTSGSTFAGDLGSSGAGGGFERLTLQINANRQLSVVHMERDPDVRVTVTVVVMPLFDYGIVD